MRLRQPHPASLTVFPSGRTKLNTTGAICDYAVIDQGEETMTKAKARQRAKARAGQKAKKRQVNAGQPEQKIRPGQFDPGPGSIKSPRGGTDTRNFAVARRGAARSR